MTIADKLSYLNGTKKAIKNALIDKGVEVSGSDSFRSYADKVASIETGGGSGSIVRAYLPTEYSGSTEKGTKLLLNTKDYYIQETAEWEAEPPSAYNVAWSDSFVADSICATSVGESNYHRIYYKNSNLEFHTFLTSSSRRYIAFLPNSKDTILLKNGTGLTQTSAHSFELFSPTEDTVTGFEISKYGFGGCGSRTVSSLLYLPLIAKKEEPHLIRAVCTHDSLYSTTYLCTLDLKNKTYSSTVYPYTSRKFRTVGSWAIDPNQRIYILFLDRNTNTLLALYWDTNEAELSQIDQELPTAPTAFRYAVQFPTTLTINGEEVMYSFLNTGGDLYVYSFKESTMMWAEEPAIAQLIKDQLGTFSDNVNIQPQMDGTLYCTNDLIMCAFSFNSDGTITQIAHPCSDYVGKLENLVEFNAAVNKYAGTAGLCYRLSTDPSQNRGYMFHFVYFKLEPHEDTGELEWVAYDKKRSNYAVESITGISTGVTGTTEDGRDYVECTVSLPEE